MLQSTGTRLKYVSTFFTFATLSGFAMAKFSWGFLETITLGDSICPTEESCVEYGELTVMKFSFSLVVYFGILCLLTIGVNNTKTPRASIHNGAWFLKKLLLIGMVIGFWFIPNKFYAGYSLASLFGSVLYLIFQALILLDLADDINGNFMEKYESGGKIYFITLLFITFSLFGGSLIMMGLLYRFYGGSECSVNLFFVSFNLIVSVIASVMSILPFIQEHRPKVGLFQSAVITFYTTCLVWGSVTLGDAKCDTLKNDDAVMITSYVFSSVFFVVSGWYWISMDTGNGQDADTVEPLLNKDQDELKVNSDGKIEVVVVTDNDDERDGTKYRYWMFHLVLCAGGLYLGMLVTNWGTLKISDDTIVGGPDERSIWVQIVASWIVLLLYVWMLIAPILLPNRDFS